MIKTMKEQLIEVKIAKLRRLCTEFALKINQLEISLIREKETARKNKYEGGDQ